MNRWQKLWTLAQVVPRKPREVIERVKHLSEVQLDRLFARPAYYDWTTPAVSESRLAETLEVPGTVHDELAHLQRAVATELRELPPDSPIELIHCAVGSLARTAYTTCRATRPRRVVETGVAYGVTSRYVLEALRADGDGHLHSIDLPPLGDEEGAHVGALVSCALRPHWSLHRGSTRRLLPWLLAELGEIDMFIHDSLHTARTMRWEFETVWPHLSAGGVLLADDIDGNAAFHDFVAATSPAHTWAVRDEEGPGYFGVILK